MSRFLYMCIAVLLSASIGMANSDSRRWTLTNGESFTAELVKYDVIEGKAHLRINEQDEKIYDITEFTAIDGAWLLEWAKVSEELEKMIGEMDGEFLHFHHKGEYTSDYYVYTPSAYKQSTNELPLLILFHPGGKGARYVQRFMLAAEELGIIILSSDSFFNTTNDEGDAQQLATLKELLPSIDAAITYDKDQLFMGGTSGGAMSAYGYSHKISDRKWAGIFANGGWLGGTNYFDKPYPAGMKIAMVNGHNDKAANNWIKPDAEVLESRGDLVNIFAFEGGHQVPPTSVQIEALTWMLHGDASITNAITSAIEPPVVSGKPCRVTITNPSNKEHVISIVTSDGTVILAETVPALGNKRPAIWQTTLADISGMVLTVSVDGHAKEVSIASDTAEFILDVASPGHIVSQHTTQVEWK